MEYILILDFNTFQSKMIARVLRSNHIYTIIQNGDCLASSVNTEHCKGMILCGDYAGSLTGIEMDKNWLNLQIPVLALGSCALALNMMFGGKAEEEIIDDSLDIEYSESLTSVLQTQNAALIKGRGLIPGDRMKPLSYVNGTVCIDIKHVEKEIYGVQRIFERNDPNSILMIENFVHKICNYTWHWDVDSYVDNLIKDIAIKYIEHNIYIAVSGGIESAVSACIFKEAFQKGIHCLFIDTGFFREHEPEEILNFYRNILKLPVTYIDAKEDFLNALKDVEDNGTKIDIVKKKLTEIIQHTIGNTPKTLLVSGANYNDLLYKPHHFLAPKEDHEHYELFYPIKNLFKFEIKNLGERFILADNIIHRKPFNSAGLATSIVGKVTAEKLSMLKRIYELFINEIQESGFSKKICTYNVTLCPSQLLKNKYIIYLHATQNTQNYISYAYRMPYDVLERITENIFREFPSTTKQVVYDITPLENLTILE